MSQNVDMTGDTLVVDALTLSAGETIGGNETVTGNLVVTGTSTLTGAQTLTGNTAFSGTLTGGSGSNIAINTNKFTVAAASGNTVVAGTLGVTSDVAVNTNKFNVTASSGNTTVAGTLGVTGVTTTTGGLNLATGTTALAPVNFTAGTNLTTATAGAMEFDGTAFYATSVASSRQQVDAEQFVIATANSATYNNTLLDSASAAPVFTTTTSGTAAGAITLAAGKTYCFEFMYNLTNTGTTSHTWATLLAGTATFTAAGTAYTVTGNSSGTSNAAATGGLSGFISGSTMSTAVVVTSASTSATEQVTIAGMGTLVVNAGGTIIPSLKASARPGASGTPGVVVIAGSFFRIWEMSSSAAVGNWS